MSERQTQQLHDRGYETAGECQFCGQRVGPEETVPVTVDRDGDRRQKTFCRYCAESVFGDADAVSLGDDSRVTGDDSRATGGGTERVPARRADTGGDGLVPPAPELGDGSGRGVGGTLLAYHRASLAFLWRVHESQLRITERLFDEVDVETVLLVGFVLTAVTTWIGLGAAVLIALA